MSSRIYMALNNFNLEDVKTSSRWDNFLYLLRFQPTKIIRLFKKFKIIIMGHLKIDEKKWFKIYLRTNNPNFLPELFKKKKLLSSLCRIIRKLLKNVKECSFFFSHDFQFFKVIKRL
ncbi:hypothetical protein ACKWTF_013745 [Chironomus riparius]